VFAVSLLPMEKNMALTRELFDSGVPRSESQVIGDLFAQAQARLRDTVMMPLGRTFASRDFRRGRAADLLGQIDPIIRQLKTGAATWTGKNVPAVYREGKRTADRQAREAGVRIEGSGFSGSFSLIDRRAVAVFARDIAMDLNKSADSMGKRAERILRATAQHGLSETQINARLAAGVIEGTPRETIKALRDDLAAVHGDTVTIMDKNGEPREFGVGYYAEMVARTKTREATVYARHERLRELDLDLVAIVGRVSTNFCSAFLGQVFSLSGTSTKYEAYDSLPDGGPPFHPNCSKGTRPFIEELAEEDQLAQAEILPDAKTMLGMDTTQAQRAYKDLQLHAQIKDRYATTEEKLFGKKS
jgi:hypothetical protein